MPKFELVSDFRPTGDQPEAIATLVEGIHKDYRYQTLPGATGTGKSLGYDDLIYVVEERAKECSPRLTPIGPLIDSLIAEAKAGRRLLRGTFILDANTGPVRYYTQAFNPETCEVALYPIQSFMRHIAPPTMYRLKTTCGRTVTLTGNHNLWVLREGRLQLIPTTEARRKDYVPLPEELLGEGSFKTLDILALLTGSGLRIEASQAVNAYADEHGWDQIDRIVREYWRIRPVPEWARRPHKFRQRFELEPFQAILQATNNLGGHWDPTTASIGGSRFRYRLPAQVELTPAFLRTIGQAIAHGTFLPTYAQINVGHELAGQDIAAVLAQLGFPSDRPISPYYRMGSVALAALFSRLCGADDAHKHLPYFWAQLSQSDLAHLLRGYYDAAGNVTPSSTIFSLTTSRQLAMELLYALMRFGIWARCQLERHAPTREYYTVFIFGQRNFKQFQENIDFTIPAKQAAVAGQRTRYAHSIVDLVPISGDDLEWLRTELDLSQSELGRHMDLSRRNIGAYEREDHRPQRTSLLKVLAGLREVALVSRPPQRWWDTWEGLRSLCRLHWTRIASIQRIQYDHPFVYDLSVPGAETLLAGAGGLFVHDT